MRALPFPGLESVPHAEGAAFQRGPCADRQRVDGEVVQAVRLVAQAGVVGVHAAAPGQGVVVTDGEVGGAAVRPALDVAYLLRGRAAGVVCARGAQAQPVRPDLLRRRQVEGLPFQLACGGVVAESFGDDGKAGVAVAVREAVGGCRFAAAVVAADALVIPVQLVRQRGVPRPLLVDGRQGGQRRFGAAGRALFADAVRGAQREAAPGRRVPADAVLLALCFCLSHDERHPPFVLGRGARA